MNSLATRIWLLISVPFVIAIFAYLAVTRPFRRDLLLAEAARDARDDVHVMEAAIARGLVDAKDQGADLTALAESIAHGENVVAVGLYGRDADLLGGSAQLAHHPGMDAIARDALAKRVEINRLREDGTPLLEHALPLQKAGKVAVAVVVRDISYVDRLVGAWTRSLVLVGAAFSLTVFLLARPMVRRFLGAPLEQLVRGVEKVSAGDLGVRVEEARKDELGRLAVAFNEMTENLRAARAHLEAQNEARVALEAHLRRLSTLAAAGEMAASLAHEIGSPLGVILGRTRMMAAREGTPEPTRRDLGIVAEQTERITRVVQRLLDVTRPPKQRIEQVDVEGVATDVLAFLAPECKKRGIKTHVVCEGGAALVEASRDQLFQVLFNLCHNAVQAQPEGGRIDVTLTRREADVEIRVADSGPGVAAEVRGRIFDPFVTTKDDAGTGLGLAIVAGLVRELGGHVAVEASEGPTETPSHEHGACFVVTLPRIA